jgi:hypothetical protein
MILASTTKVLSIPIIRDNEINITESEWTELNKELTQEQIIQLISDAMDEVEMPMRKILHAEAISDFKALQTLDTTSLIKDGKTFTRYDYKYEVLDKYIDIDKTGNLSSDYFHQEARWHCDSLNAPSPFRTWTTEKFRKNCLKNLWTMKTTKVDMTRLRSCLALRNYIASQFRPSAAKAIYEMYNSRRVWDFSAGWGDRLAGFAATPYGQTYYGTDPNEAVMMGYIRQKQTYKSYSNAKICLDNQPAEDSNIFKNEKVDTVFTSPPYFDTERYSTQDTQSWKRYKKLDAWIAEFLCVAVYRAWNMLEVGGTLAINIADTYGHHRRNEMCDPMNDFISTLTGAEYQGAIGYRMAKRPNSAADKTGIFVEPIWVWKKLS